MKYIYRILFIIMMLNSHLFGADLVANAGEDTTLNVTPSHKAVHLDGSKSSSSDNIVSYKWYEGDKYIGAGKSRWYGLTQNGEHTITLKIVDETGEKAEDSMTITVVNGEGVVNPPKPSELKANAGADKTLKITATNRAVHLDGTKSSSENKIVSYKWYEGDKYIGAGKSRWYVLTQQGEHNIKLKVTDTTGATAEDSMRVTVTSENTNDNHAPTASNVVMSGTAKVGETLTLNYLFKDVDGDKEGASIIAWSTPIEELQRGTSKTFTIPAGREGQEIGVYLHLIDEHGVHSTKVYMATNNTLTILPKDGVPTTLTANAGEDKTLNVTTSSRAVHLDGSKSSSENKIVSYKWYEGEKYIGAGKSRWYGLTQSGEHIITLKIVDETGEKVEDSIVITVVNGDPENCDMSTAITKETLLEMIENGDDVTQVNTCAITDMSALFENATTFNQDISGWDVSNVTNMSGMFHYAEKFNQPIGRWDVSNVTNMSYMFDKATSFNQPIGECDVSNVTTMRQMFNNATDFNQPIGEWDVSSVTNMMFMFFSAYSFNQPIGEWDVSNVTIMNAMFYSAINFNQPIGEWDVSNVTNMLQIFYNAKKFNQSIEDWNIINISHQDVSEYTRGSGLIDKYNPFRTLVVTVGENKIIKLHRTIPLTGEVTTVSNGSTIVSYEWKDGDTVLANTLSFDYTLSKIGTHKLTLTVIDNKGRLAQDSLTILVRKNICDESTAITREELEVMIENKEDITEVNTCMITDMSYLFKNIDKVPDITAWNVLHVTNMKGMFEGAGYIPNIAEWNVSNVTDMSKMFYGTGNFPNIEKWDVSSVTDMSWMLFYSQKKAKKEENRFDQNLTSWDVSNVTNMSGMFASDPSNYRDNYDFYANEPKGLAGWDVSKVTNMSNMFDNAWYFNEPIGNWDVSNVTNMGGMFNATWLFNQPLESWDVSNVTNMAGMFRWSGFNQSVENWDVSNVSNMSAMFYQSLHFNQPLEKWDVSNVTNMIQMFRESSFNQPLEKWDVSNVTDMSAMFYKAYSFNQPLEKWDVSNVTNMFFMFFDTWFFNQPLEKWDVSNVTGMAGMFSGDDFMNPFNQPLEKWDVSNVTDMGAMFRRSKFNQPLEKWDVSSVINMDHMFHIAVSFNQPIGGWDVSNVTNMSGMFYITPSFNQNIKDWDVSSVVSYSSFATDSALKDEYNPFIK